MCVKFYASYPSHSTVFTGILVRDDRARDRLRAEVGDIGLILSVHLFLSLQPNYLLK